MQQTTDNVFNTSSEGPSGTFLRRRFRTSLRCQKATSQGRQMGTYPGWSNRMFNEGSGDVGREHPGEQYFQAWIFLIMKRLSPKNTQIMTEHLKCDG